MGRPPAYVFVVRHGARLDQADKRWHLASPTPYDPPLTYGGWLQTQAVGARIASILREAEEESNEAFSGPGASGKRRRFRIAVHSSPFLRCIQSSIGITAGLAQNPPRSSAPASPLRGAESPGPDNDGVASPAPLASSPEPPLKLENQKVPIRVDAFLGEWLNPEYFESITHPPGSSQMISTAKIALLRKETISAYQSPRPHAGSVSSTHGQLWSSPRMNPSPVDPAGLNDMPAMASALPRTRADSGASAVSLRSRGSGELPRNEPGYVAPIPSYAISTNAKIPDGYVAHARDACAAADYQWDSTDRWIDGGSFPEEWITMHKRFRAGFQSLVDWYSTTENPTDLTTTTSSGGTAPAQDQLQIDDEEDVENVVVIVSHGAGCNAMIGAITRQPVLMNVGVATLTMAVRKPDVAGDVGSAESNLPLDQYYDLKIQASNEHLRNMASASGLGRTPSSSSNTGIKPLPRGRVSTMSSYGTTSGSAGFSLPDMDVIGSRSNSVSGPLGDSTRRPSNTIITATTTKRNITPPVFTGMAVGLGLDGASGSGLYQTQSPTGLWSPITSQTATKSQDDDMDELFPDFDGTRRLSSVATSDSTPRTQPGSALVDGTRTAVKSPLRLQEISRPTSRDGEAKPDVGSETSRTTGSTGGGLWGT